MKKILLGAALLPCLMLSAPARAALPGFTYLEDEAEAGGFDVTAKLNSPTADWSLCEQENGDGYRLRFSPAGIELGLAKGKTTSRLALYGKAITPGPVVIQRRGPRWRVIAEKRVLFEADDDTWEEGKVGFRGGFSDARLQPSDDVAFDDDFMRVATDVALAEAKDDPRKGVRINNVKSDETVWTNIAGAWSTSGLTENPEAQVAQSANPFAFKAGAKGENLAVAGKNFWDDYSAEVSVKPEGASAIGIAVYAQDDKNYLLLHWKASGPVQLRGVVDGKVRVLGEAPLNYDQEQWYRLRLSAANGWVRGYIDDNEVVRARTGLFGRGQVGLYAENATAEVSAIFDDVSVRSISDFADDFRTPVPGRWRTVAGTWQTNAQNGFTMPTGAQGAFSVMGESAWDNYIASAEIELPATSAAGVLLYHKPGEGTYVARIAGSKAAVPYAGRAQIVKIAGGKTEVLDEVRTGTRFDGKVTQWDFSSERGYLRASADNVRLLDAYDESIESGRPGLFAQGDAKTAPKIHSFTVEFPQPRPTWAKVPDLYTVGNQPQTMGEWSTPEGSWAPLTPIAGNTTGSTGVQNVDTSNTSNIKTFWHKGAFWGDGTIRFKLPALDGDKKLALVFGDPQRRAVSLNLQGNGTTLKGALARGVSGGPMTEVTKGEITVDGKIEGQAVEVARRGRFVIVRVGETNQKLLVAKVLG